MSFINGLLMGMGQGLSQGGAAYFDALERKRQRERDESQDVDRRMATIQQLMQNRDELEERKRSNRSQEALEHERNVQQSLDRGLERENQRAYREATDRRAVEVAMINAERAREVNAASNASREKVAGMPARTREGGATSNPDGLTQGQRDGLMLLNRRFNPNDRAEQDEKHELEQLYRQAREAFPNAHPGDVAMAARRMYDRLQQERKNRY